MKILILDDVQLRLDIFRRLYEGHEVMTVRHFHEYVTALQSQKWDLVHLDHDLGDFLDEGDQADSYVDGWGCTREYNGCHAVDAICALDEAMRPERVIIHSVNGPGSMMMRRTLERFGITVTREPYSEPDCGNDENP